jgi:hypothetical protein
MNLALELLTPTIGFIAILAIMVQQSHKARMQLKRVKVKANSKKL